jgi:hypothetical protein
MRHYAIVTAIFAMTSIGLAAIGLRAHYFNYDPSEPVATEIVDVPDRCYLLAMFDMHGLQKAELNAYEARRIENDLKACGASVHLKRK